MRNPVEILHAAQQLLEIMGGRIPLTEYDAVIPENLCYVMTGALTA